MTLHTHFILVNVLARDNNMPVASDRGQSTSKVRAHSSGHNAVNSKHKGIPIFTVYLSKQTNQPTKQTNNNHNNKTTTTTNNNINLEANSSRCLHEYLFLKKYKVKTVDQMTS